MTEKIKPKVYKHTPLYQLRNKDGLHALIMRKDDPGYLLVHGADEEIGSWEYAEEFLTVGAALDAWFAFSKKEREK